MDRKAVARELRQRLFDFIESERREALQDSAIDKLFEDVLAKHEQPAPAWPYISSTAYIVRSGDKIIDIESGRVYLADPNEIGILAQPD